MGCESHTPHIFLFPFLAHGHMIPTIDMAKTFAAKGTVKVTIVTTPLNAPFISKTIEKSIANGHIIHIKTIEFPCTNTGLPNGCENVDSLPSLDCFSLFCMATKLLQQPLEQLLIDDKPNCIIADMFFPWTTNSAAKFGIPRIVFHGTSFFALSATKCMSLNYHYIKVSSDSEPFVIPNFPGDIKFTMSRAPPVDDEKKNPYMAKLLREMKESERRSYGVVVNSFYELENVYADYFRNEIGKKAWHIGPLSLCNRETEEKANRGKEASINEHECLKWLDMKKPHSVVYICFGSMANFIDSQLRDIALGLEASGKEFIWVVRKSKKDNGEEWLPDQGFEKRMEGLGKGLIIRGWAPQVLILEHQAIGAFVTHCGWNSILEGVTSGVPMVTWPIAAEQFYNEKLVTEVLQIGVPVGAKKWIRLVGDRVSWEGVEKAVKRIMEGEEALQMMKRVKVLSELAKKAVEEGGSSHSDLNAFIEELCLLSH